MTVDVPALAELDREEVEERIYDQAVKKYGEKEAMLGPDGEADSPRNRADGNAQRDRQPVERPPVVDGSLEGRYRAARLRSKRPARRIQERVLPDVPGHDGSHRRRDDPVPVLHAALRRASAPRRIAVS